VQGAIMHTAIGWRCGYEPGTWLLSCTPGLASLPVPAAAPLGPTAPKPSMACPFHLNVPPCCSADLGHGVSEKACPAGGAL
jgi:hypothetical protein